MKNNKHRLILFVLLMWCNLKRHNLKTLNLSWAIFGGGVILHLSAEFLKKRRWQKWWFCYLFFLPDLDLNHKEFMVYSTPSWFYNPKFSRVIQNFFSFWPLNHFYLKRFSTLRLQNHPQNRLWKIHLCDGFKMKLAIQQEIT